jgi:hypothetical protein
MPDVAQQLIDTLLFRWTWCAIASLVGNRIDSDLMDSITKEPIIRPAIGKEDVVIIVR